MITINMCEEPCAYLVLPCASGVTYTAQCGGLACAHYEIEGAILASAPTEEDAMCGLGWYCGEDWTSETIAKADAYLASLTWSAFTNIENLRLDPVRLDPERLSGSIEGWWFVTFDLVCPIDQSPPSRGLRGIVMGPNCD